MLLVWSGAALAGGQSAADSARVALQAELSAILGEIEESQEVGADPFAGGAKPDLVILTSANLGGEVAPCG